MPTEAISSSGSRSYSIAIAPAMPPTFMSASIFPIFVQPSILPSVPLCISVSDISVVISLSVFSSSSGLNASIIIFVILLNWLFIALKSSVILSPDDFISLLSPFSSSDIPFKEA